ncbi:hypothetical protein SCB29_20140 [Paraburkholderia sp. SIMBA_055]
MQRQRVDAQVVARGRGGEAVDRTIERHQLLEHTPMRLAHRVDGIVTREL